MTLIIQKPTSSKLILAKTYVGIDDPDAAAYIAQVEAADEAASPGIGPLETATKVAIHSFFKGCKSDGTWPAIKAACILAGAKTRQGALVPLLATMPAPTSFNFVAGDYDRKLGLVGNGSTKYLDSNRNNNADPQDSCHNSIFCSTIGTGAVLGPTTSVGASGINSMSNAATRNRNSSADLFTASNGFVATNRSNSASYFRRNGSVTTTVTSTSAPPDGGNVLLFQFAGTYSTTRLAFYSIGESLNLAQLDTRVTDLINAIGVAF